MSKRVINHPELLPAERQTVAWRSAGELEKTPEFKEWLEREFPEKSGELTEEERELSRRNFVKLMGASSALAGLGLASCRRPDGYIVPYKEAPEWVIPGKALYYASTMPSAKGAVPLLVSTTEGRPIKLEPNRDHPDSNGTSSFVQASILNLYDPNRSQAVLNEGKKSSWDELKPELAKLAQSGAKVGFVFGEDDSPTRNRLVKELRNKFKGSRFYRYEALESHEDEKVNGTATRVQVDFTKAKKILSLDSDFCELDPQGNTKGFFDGRQGGANEGGKLYGHELEPKKMNRLYQVESQYSLTGGLADHRLRVAPSQVAKVAAAVAKELGVAVAAPELDEKLQKWVKACAADLKAGDGVIVAGSRQPQLIHQLAAAMNQKLGATGSRVKLLQTETQVRRNFDRLVKDIEAGMFDVLVLATPANPVYDSPSDVDFEALLAKVPTTIHLGLRTDATAYATTWHIPAAHYLESWGDTLTSTGTYSLVQPMILPLFGGVGEFELLSALLGDGQLQLGDEKTPSAGFDEVRKTFDARFNSKPETWAKALQDGFVESSYAEAKPAAVASFDESVLSIAEPTAESLEVIFAADGSVWDGRYIDNSWLQEAPDPISKLTWDNVAYVSPKTADALGITKRLVELRPKNNVAGIEVENAPQPEIGEGEKAKAPVVTIKLGENELEIPVLVSFGLAENTIVLPLGYGQARDDEWAGGNVYNPEKPVTGLVGLNSGFNGYALKSSSTSYVGVGATISTGSGKYPVALTQEHHAMYGRALAREISTADIDGKDFEHQLKGSHGVAKQGMDSHMPPNKTIYRPEGKKENGERPKLISDEIHQWAMAIDLNTCTGCNSCLIACQAENNIPVVGKEQVAKGREMHWIRMDRYYASYEPKHGHGKDDHAKEPFDADNPEMIPQPVACVQCELAPCETVCPVNATVHNEEGLNVMAYNRCIGTRYCANNCPYKARRFNFFDYNKRNPLVKNNLYRGPLGEKQEGDVRHLQRNPNVSVRMRGVMEKCTYCVQRLENAKIKQKQIQKKKALGMASTEVQVGNEDLRIKVDSVKVACQEACSANAITFGNKLDGDKSAMVRAKSSARNYDLLNYIGTLPRTSYLARVKNPNPAMPDIDQVGRATIHIH